MITFFRNESVVGSSKLSLWLFQFGVVVLVFCTSMGASILRIKYADRLCSQKIIDRLNVCAGGMFLGMAFNHLLPEAMEKLPPLESPNLNPVGICVFLGYSLILFCERVVASEASARSSSSVNVLKDGVAATDVGLQDQGAHSESFIARKSSQEGKTLSKQLTPAETEWEFRRLITTKTMLCECLQAHADNIPCGADTESPRTGSTIPNGDGSPEIAIAMRVKREEKASPLLPDNESASTTARNSDKSTVPSSGDDVTSQISKNSSSHDSKTIALNEHAHSEHVHAHNHGNGRHSHSHDDSHDDHDHHGFITQQGTGAYILMTALSVHSIFDGLIIGMAGNIKTCALVSLCVICHKWAASFAIGSAFATAKIPQKRALGFLLIFSISSPIGVLIGAIIAGIQNVWLEGLTNALATGTLLYIAMSEIITEEFVKTTQPKAKFGSLFIGYAFIVAVQMLDMD